MKLRFQRNGRSSDAIKLMLWVKANVALKTINSRRRRRKVVGKESLGARITALKEYKGIVQLQSERMSQQTTARKTKSR